MKYKRIYTFEYVQEYFQKEKLELITKDFEYHPKKRLKYICRCGHTVEKLFYDFLRTKKCNTCYGGRKNFNIEDVRKILKDLNCKLISKKYINVKQILTFKCSCGNVCHKNLYQIRKSPRCKECIKKLTSKSRKGKNNYNWIEDRESVTRNKKFRQKCSNMIKECLLNINEKKKDKSHKILGYTIRNLIDHIENHSNWPNVKNKKWHLDHIFPIKAFIDYGVTDLKIINCLENLQPLSDIENTSKGCKYDKAKFENWLNLKGIKVYNGL